MAQITPTPLSAPLADLLCRVLAFHGRRVPSGGADLLSTVADPKNTIFYWAAPDADNAHSFSLASEILEMAMHSSHFSKPLLAFMNPPRSILFATVHRLMLQLAIPLARTVKWCTSLLERTSASATDATRTFAQHAPLMMQWLGLLAAADGGRNDYVATWPLGTSPLETYALVDTCWDEDAAESELEWTPAMRAAAAMATAYTEQLRSSSNPEFVDSTEASQGRLWICMLMRLLVQTDVASSAVPTLKQAFVAFDVRGLILELLVGLLTVPTVATPHAVMLVFQSAMGSKGEWRHLALLPDCLDLLSSCFQRWSDQPTRLQAPECRLSALNLARPVCVHPWDDAAETSFGHRRHFSMLDVLLSTAVMLVRSAEEHGSQLFVSLHVGTTPETTEQPIAEWQQVAARCVGAAYALIWMFQQMGTIPSSLDAFVDNAPRYLQRRCDNGVEDHTWGGYRACENLRTLLPVLRAQQVSNTQACLALID